MDEATLKRVQETELEILVAVDAFCRENGINYSLAGGTALGAVRHGGFIPWDDDIDICMDRNEYDAFLSAWRERPRDGFILDPDDVDGCRINHTKIRKENTLLASEWELAQPIRHEIWIDVFPMDKVPVEPSARKSFLRSAKLRLVYTRDEPYTRGGALLNIASRLLLCKTKAHKRRLRAKYERRIKQYKDLDGGFEYLEAASPGTLGMFYPADIMETEDATFEGKTMRLFKDAHRYLTVQYGDYMTLPPEEDRVCRHKPFAISFDVAADEREK